MGRGCVTEGSVVMGVGLSECVGTGKPESLSVAPERDWSCLGLVCIPTESVRNEVYGAKILAAEDAKSTEKCNE